MCVPGSADRRSVRSGFKKNSWPRWPRHNAPLRNSVWSLCSALPPRSISAGWRIRTDRSRVRELFSLIREYCLKAGAAALSKAHATRAFGADYIANILRQQQMRRETQPPLRLRDPALNELACDPLSLAEYDAFILHS